MTRKVSAPAESGRVVRRSANDGAFRFVTVPAATSVGAAAHEVRISVPAGLSVELAATHIEAVFDALLARSTVQDAISAAPAAVSPDMLAAIGRQDREWRNLEAQHGMLTGAQVADAARSKAANKAEYASQLRRSNKVLAVRRGRDYMFPAFQFRADGRVHPVIPKLLTVLTGQQWDELSIALWMNSPNGYLAGATPIDRISDSDAVLEAASGAAHIGE